MDQRKNIERVGFCGGNSRSVWRIMHKSLDSSFSRRRPSPEQTFCCWLAECVHKNSTAHCLCKPTVERERRESDPSRTLDYTLSLYPYRKCLCCCCDGLYVNLAYTRGGGVKYFMRHGSSRFLFKLDSEYYSRFPFLLAFSTLLSLSLSVYVRLLIFPFVFLMKNPTFLGQFALDSFHLLPLSCAHTRNFFYFLFRLSRVFLTFLSRLLYLHFPIFFPILLARYANNAMATALHLMRCSP
jgi:hypothetical protein